MRDTPSTAPTHACNANANATTGKYFILLLLQQKPTKQHNKRIMMNAINNYTE